MSSTTKKTKTSSKTAPPPAAGEKNKKPATISSAPTSPWVDERSKEIDPPCLGREENVLRHSYRTLSQRKGRLALLLNGIPRPWPRELLEFHRHSLLQTPVRVLPRLGLPLRLETSRQGPLNNSGIFLLTLEGSTPTWRRPCTRFTVG